MSTGDDYSSLSEKDLFEMLHHAVGKPSKDHNMRGIRGLEEANKRLKENLIVDKEEFFSLLLKYAYALGDKQPFSSLILDGFNELIRKDDYFFTIMLDKVSESRNSMILFSSLVRTLDFKKKRQAIETMVDFLVNRTDVNQKGSTETLNALIEFGENGLGKDVVRASSSYLDSSLSKLPAIIYSLKLCSKFADSSLTQKMLSLLEDASKGRFGTYTMQVYREVILFIERIKDPRALSVLLRLADDEKARQAHYQNALSEIIKSNPNSVEYLIEAIHDSNNNDGIFALINALHKSEVEADPVKLLSALLRGGKYKYPLDWRIGDILSRSGNKAKAILLEMIKDKENYDFALETLGKIGIKQDEIYSIFSKPPMLQFHNFFFGKNSKHPYEFNKMLEAPEKLDREVKGKQTVLDFLIQNLFSSFGFLTMQVDSSGYKGVDVLCFNSDSCDVLIIGCTTGVIKDDLKKIDALLSKMQKELPEVIGNCKVTPLIVSTGTTKFVSSDLKDAKDVGAILLGLQNLGKIVDMLYTNRNTNELLNYLDEIKIEQNESVEPSYNSKY